MILTIIIDDMSRKITKNSINIFSIYVPYIKIAETLMFRQKEAKNKKRENCF